MNSSVQAKTIMNLLNCPDTLVALLSCVNKHWKYFYYILPISYSKEISHRVLRTSHKSKFTRECCLGVWSCLGSSAQTAGNPTRINRSFLQQQDRLVRRMERKAIWVSWEIFHRTLLTHLFTDIAGKPLNHLSYTQVLHNNYLVSN